MEELLLSEIFIMYKFVLDAQVTVHSKPCHLYKEAIQMFYSSIKEVLEETCPLSMSIKGKNILMEFKISKLEGNREDIPLRNSE